MSSNSQATTPASSSGNNSGTGNDRGNNNNNTETENTTNTDTSGGRNSNGGTRNRSNRRNTFSANERTWEGDTSEVGAVLGLRTEYLDKKASFRVFSEKMEEYVSRKVNNGSDLLPLL